MSERLKMVKAFDETEAGVKGLSDSGVLQIPKIFVRPKEDLEEESIYKTVEMEVPVIDLSSGDEQRIVEEMRVAAETWGFFQVVNHGIPPCVVDGMIEGIRNFHEMDVEEKRKYYSRDASLGVKFNCNNDLFFSTTANWRDTLSISFSDQINAQDLPLSCRKSTIEYSKHAAKVGNNLLELLWMGLGLNPHHLKNMECSKGCRLSCHYYPPCPQPQLTLGVTKHTDPSFITLLLQNQVNALQVLYQNQWVPVNPNPGALLVNIGDLLQLVSNGRFQSSKHRVISSMKGPRISVAMFFAGPINDEMKTYGPIKELLSEENPALYKELVLKDYIQKFVTRGLDKSIGLDHYKL